MKTNTITTWAQLKTIIGPEQSLNIFKQGIDGDPDWLTDILGEHNDGIKPDNVFYIKGFHDILKPYKIDLENIDRTYRADIKNFNNTNFNRS